MGVFFPFTKGSAGPGTPKKLAETNGTYGLDALDLKPDCGAVTFSLYEGADLRNYAT